jgi:hypothetical protein
MRITAFLALTAWGLSRAGTEPQAPADPLEQMKALAGEWQADLPGFGQINDSIQLVSKGTAVEETLGTSADNEVSIYTRDGKQLLLTHFCALTTDGHVARLESVGQQQTAGPIELTLVATSNLHETAAPMSRCVLTHAADPRGALGHPGGKEQGR